MTERDLYDFEFNTAVAVIGMAGRFPGANTLDQFWHNLSNGVKSIQFFSDEDLIKAGVDPALINQPDYVKAGTVIDHIETFDAAFFGFTPREVELMDPQLRLFLECSWEAFEDAGYATETYPGLVGVFGGSAISSYMLNNIFPNEEVYKRAGFLQVGVLNSSDSLSTWVSYKLNFRGPSVVVQTFCSTSLVAVHTACQSVLNYECDIALAGGVCIAVPQGTGYTYQEGGIVSPDGECRTFDAAGQGSVMGNGAGVVVFKRLDEAIQDGDHIYAVIRGSAVNNDGIMRVGYTAPGLEGQAAVIAEALSHSGVDPETISYFEAHGTATALGDSIELAATIKAFKQSTDKTQFCALGSVKPNVGHLDRAAGVTGLIKTLLAFQHGALPPSLNFERPSQEIDLENSPFFVNTTLRSWTPPANTPRRAGVSSFGLGGTNAHVVLQETPALPATDPALPGQLLVISAKTRTALATAATNLARFLREHPDINLADVAHTLQVGRNAFNHRQALVVNDVADAIQQLENTAANGNMIVDQRDRQRPIAFLFPGVGDHYIGMAQELYTHQPVFRDTVDQCCALLQPILDTSLVDLIYPEQSLSPSVDLRTLLGRGAPATEAGPLQQTALAQPAVFVVEYALAQLLRSWGIVPQALLGYSLGEYVAATVAGVLGLEDALRLVATRARLIQALPAGAMLAVNLSAEAVAPYLRAPVDLAVVTGPQACVLAGPVAELEAVAARLERDEIAARWLTTSHAFHSQMLAPLQAEVTALAATLRLAAPQIPYVSNVTGTWITAKQATDPGYWAAHMVQTVRFGDGVGVLLENPALVLVEVGPGQALGSFVRQHPACGRDRFNDVISLMPAPQDRANERAQMLQAIGRLWLAGQGIEWSEMSSGTQRRRLSLPTYPFERQRFWIDAKPQWATKKAPVNDAFLTSSERIENLGDWFFTPSFKRSNLAIVPHGRQIFPERNTWLVLRDSGGIMAALIPALEQADQQVVIVTPGSVFAATGPASYSVRADSRDDYIALLQALARKGLEPTRVIHAWLATDTENVNETAEEVEETLKLGFYSLLALTQALGNEGIEQCEITTISTGLHAVSGDEAVQVSKSTIIGPCKIIPQEHSQLTARSIDVVLPCGPERLVELTKQLVQELASPPTGDVVALRGAHRWVQTYAPIHLPDYAGSPARLRDQGVYLITGGLGGIALALAEYLATGVRARLALVGRTPLPPRERWSSVIAAEGTERGVGRRIHLVQQLEARGAEVLILQADVAKSDQMAAAVAQAVEHFGTINGIFHTAGVPGAGLMQLKTPEAAASVLAAKVQGTLAVTQAARDLPLDFLVLFSSVAAAAGGGPGQADYCAANVFMDTYAQQHHHDHGTTISIGWGEWHWDAWSEGLQGFSEEVRAFFIASRQAYGISFPDGMESLRRILASNLPQVFVSPRDLNFLVEAGHQLFASFLHARDESVDQTLYPRPTLGSTYIAPRTTLETHIAAIWSDVLGIEPIGVDDNFFELGGNSLLGLNLFARIRKSLQLDQFPAYVLYEAPTVESQAAYITELRAPQQSQDTSFDDFVDEEESDLRAQLNYFMELDEMGDL